MFAKQRGRVQDHRAPQAAAVAAQISSAPQAIQPAAGEAIPPALPPPPPVQLSSAVPIPPAVPISPIPALPVIGAPDRKRKYAPRLPEEEQIERLFRATLQFCADSKLLVCV